MQIEGPHQQHVSLNWDKPRKKRSVKLAELIVGRYDLGRERGELP